MKKNKKAFTLLEIMVVIIIVGILAALGLGKYRKSIEKGIANEAYTTINVIRALEEDYFIENNTYTNAVANNIATDINFPLPTCDNNHYFSYNFGGGDNPPAGGLNTVIRIRANRCSNSGKAPRTANTYDIILDVYSDGRAVESGGP